MLIQCSGPMRSRSSSSPSKSNGSYITKASSTGSRVIEIENTPMQKDKHDDLLDLWYDQFIEKYRINRHLKFPFKDWDSMKRTPEGMSSYLKLATMQKRRRIAFKDDKTMNSVNTVSENGTLSLRQQEMVEDDVFVIPELMYPFNCVPDNAILPLNEVGTSQKVEVSGVLDCLPHLISPSPAMIERFGIRPEYLRVEFGRIKYRGKGGTEANRKNLGQDQASQTAKKVIAQTLVSTGLGGGSGVSVQILSQFLGSHISKLGRILKLLSDSYRRQFTSTELIKMFLKITGYGNLGALSDCLKNNARNVTHQVQQGHSLQGQHEAHQLSTHQQQIQRPMLSQFNTLRPQNVFQQQQLQIQQQILQQQQQKMQVQMQQQQQQMSLQKQQMQMQQKLQRQHGMQMQQQQQIQMQQQQHMQQHKQQQIQMQQQQIPTQSQQQQIPTQSQQQQLQLQSQQQQIQTQTQQHQMLPHSQQMQSPPQQMQSSPQQIQIQQQQQQILSQSQQMQSQPQQIQLHQQQVQSPPQQLQMQQQHLQLNIQQQLMQQQIRQRQMPAARNSAMSMEKERAGAEIKGENISEHSTDGTFNPVNRQQLQFRNQQLAGSTNHHAQQSKPFKQFTVQSPQLQTQGNLNVRTPPVKVEGFQELMSGGDAAAEERKLTSPSK